MKAPPLIYQPPATDPLPVLYQDEALLIVHKPAGLLSVPGRLPEHRDSLLSRLQAIYPDALTVHRLDMATSGLMVFARGKESHRALSIAFEKRQVHKRYLARVLGTPDASGLVDLPLITDWPNRPRQIVDHDIGKPSQTEWQLLSSDGETSLVKLTPITGRSHQLRVHMAEIGHPILGDQFYGTDASRVMADRLCLHASELGLVHPVTGAPLSFETEALLF